MNKIDCHYSLELCDNNFAVFIHTRNDFNTLWLREHASKQIKKMYIIYLKLWIDDLKTKKKWIWIIMWKIHSSYINTICKCKQLKCNTLLQLFSIRIHKHTYTQLLRLCVFEWWKMNHNMHVIYIILTNW